MDFRNLLAELISGSPGKVIGAVTGMILGILVLAFGVLKILVVVIFVILGLIIGKMIDDKSSIIESIMNIFRRR